MVAYGDRMDRPYVLLSAAVSLDGALDDRSPRRRILSGPEDLDAVDALRAGCDAVLVGAGTVRADDPRLLVRSGRRRAERVGRGLPPTPARVVLTRSGDLDPAARVFRDGPPPLVYGPAGVGPVAPSRDGSAASSRDGTAAGSRNGTAAGAAVPGVRIAAADLAGVLADLAGRGVRRLLVEGGSGVLAQFLAEGRADELRLAVAPELVGDPGAPRFLGPGRAVRLLDVTALGGTAVLRYAL